MMVALIPSSVFVCDAQLCSIKKTTMTLCVFMAFSKPGRLRAMMMLLGSGVGVLPFTVNPVTPTGSTNCDTGTITLYCFTFKDSHWHTFKFCVNVWFLLLIYIYILFFYKFPTLKYVNHLFIWYMMSYDIIREIRWGEHLSLNYTPALHQFGFIQLWLSEN